MLLNDISCKETLPSFFISTKLEKYINLIASGIIENKVTPAKSPAPYRLAEGDILCILIARAIGTSPKNKLLTKAMRHIRIKSEDSIIK